MISYLKGELAEITQDGVVIEVSGIGWHIYMPQRALESLPAVGQTLKIHTYLQVREDAVTLFGFLSKDDLSVFQLLLGVNGIGPKAALTILSVMTTDDLRFAILGGDAKALAKTPGIGTKTAQRLILELKDKISFEDALEQKMAQAEQPAQNTGVKNEAVMALTALGYSSSEALKALNGIAASEDMDVETMLKLALKNMALL